MKKIALLVALMLSASGVMAQQTVETVYLKNGGLVKGEIIEQVPGQSLKVKTKDGNVFVYQMDEVERIAKETQTNETHGRHRGLDYSIDLGYNINTKGGGGMLAAELEFGKRFSKNFYWGIGGGAYIPTGDGDPLVPVTTDFKVYMPSSTSKIAPHIGLKAGYVFNTAGDETVFGTTVKSHDFIMVQIMPGIQFPLSERVDFNFGAGYSHFIPTSGSGSWGAVAIRAGFGFHKSNTKRTPVPIRDKGFQFTIEGGKMGFGGNEYDGFLGNVVLSYKLNPHLTIGVGGGVDVTNVSDDEGYIEQLTYSNGETHNNIIPEVDVDILTAKAFVRGQYRLTDKKVSPFVACDAGMRFYDYDGSFNGDYAWLSPEEKDEIFDKAPSNGVFVNPSVGLSIRTFNNSYWELRVGYSIASGLQGGNYESEGVQTDGGGNRHPYTLHAERKSFGFSAPYIQLGWTHTFGSRKR